MKLRFILLPCVLGILGAVAFAATRDRTPNDFAPFPMGSTPGRFLIIPNCPLYHPPETQLITLRLDTATGQAWALTAIPVENSGPNAAVRGWTLLDEHPVETAREISTALKDK